MTQGKKPLPPLQPYPWPHGEALEAEPQRRNGEQWVRCDTFLVDKHGIRNIGLTEPHVDPELFPHRKRKIELPDLLDAIPPAGRSTSVRSAPAREPREPTPREVAEDNASVFNAAGEDDVVIVIQGMPYTKREMALAAAESRKRLRLRSPKCAHKTISPRDGLCLNCGEIVRDS